MPAPMRAPTRAPTRARAVPPAPGRGRRTGHRRRPPRAPTAGGVRGLRRPAAPAQRREAGRDRQDPAARSQPDALTARQRRATARSTGIPLEMLVVVQSIGTIWAGRKLALAGS